MIKQITSTENKIYKQTKKLLSKSERYKKGLFIAEGKRIVKDAIEANAAEYILVSEDYDGELYDVNMYSVDKKMFSAVSDTSTTQGIIAACRMSPCDINKISGNRILICDEVSDPGNLGTLIRTAECTGMSGVVLTKGTVDPYSPKVVRSTMGSVFRIPLYSAEISDIKSNMSNYNIISTTLDGATGLYETIFPEYAAIVVGNEAYGVSDEIMKLSSLKIKIPMMGNAESLNAAVAGSVVMYELLRQNLK